MTAVPQAREPREVRLVVTMVLQEAADVVRQAKHMLGGAKIGASSSAGGGIGGATGGNGEGEDGAGSGDGSAGYRRYSRAAGGGAGAATRRMLVRSTRSTHCAEPIR